MTKFLSIGTLAITMVVYIESLFAYDDALFMFASSNVLENLIFLGLATALVWLSFQKRFRYWQAYLAATVLAIAFVLIGLAGVLSAGLAYYLSDTIKPLNFLLMIQAGVILGICSISYQHQKLPEWRAIRRQFPKWAFPKPGLPHRSGPRTAISGTAR